MSFSITANKPNIPFILEPATLDKTPDITGIAFANNAKSKPDLWRLMNASRFGWLLLGQNLTQI